MIILICMHSLFYSLFLPQVAASGSDCLCKRILWRFWKLFRAYWKSEEKWKGLGLLALVIGLNLASVYFLVAINSWYNDFYNALQQYVEGVFWPLIGKFTLLAFLYIIIAVYAIYLRQMLQIKWRTWLTDKYLARWMGRNTYYRMQVLGTDTDNPDQRISEDINQFVNLTLTLLVGVLKQLTTLGAFGVVLWNLSGAFTVPVGSHAFVIYGYMFWFSFIYSMLGTFFAHLVGRKLIPLNYDQQRYEADFRFSMMRVRENSESIAFYHGETSEGRGFSERFALVIQNFWQLMKRTKLLNFYVNGYGQLAVIVPLVLAAPQYFGGTMALGGLMQTVSAFGRVQDALSFFIDSYDTIAQFSAVIHRLAGFIEHMEVAEGKVSEVCRREDAEPGADFSVAALTVALPTGRTLFTNMALDVRRGMRLLITGVSGCGKSTLLRTLAGIWPYGKGVVSVPKGGKTLFLPQRPYLPLGTLRRALSYPRAAMGSDEVLVAALEKVGLTDLTNRLDDADDWSRILSLGEQQRLAFARVLLVRPDYVFFDEATSALDEEAETRLYVLIRKEIAGAGIVSVGHRKTLFAQHDTELHLEKDGSWSLGAIG